MSRIHVSVFASVFAIGLAGCKSSSGMTADASGSGDAPGDTTTDGGAVSPLGLTCAATATTYSPGTCPAPSGADGHADFCFRPGWPGVTSVDVYGGFPGNNWGSPLVTLADNGSGVFVGSVALANGTYPYMFRVHGSADKLVKDGQYVLDQENPAFEKMTPGDPIARSVSVLTVPQPTPAPLHHLRGTVVYNGAPQPCFSLDLEVGELLDSQNRPLSEHYTANFAQSAADGTFDFPLADGHTMAIVRFPLGLVTGYPDPTQTPSIGYARTGTDMAGADLQLDPVDVSYPEADYAAMSPIGGTGTLPETFTLTLVPGASTASVAVIGTNIAGNDPAFWSAFNTMTSVPWDGTFGNNMQAVPGTQYWWGTWQRRAGSVTTWSEESLLFPITF